jgi:hypothetical protein
MASALPCLVPQVSGFSLSTWRSTLEGPSLCFGFYSRMSLGIPEIFLGEPPGGLGEDV